MVSCRHRWGGMLGQLAFLFVVAACGSSDSAPSDSPQPGGAAEPSLASAEAERASIGREGGELRAGAPSGGPSYRLLVPAGALLSETEFSLTPIADIDGFPFSGGLLGGAELRPDGQRFGAPVTLEILLDPASQDELRTALDGGLVVLGFSYLGSGGPLSVDFADVAEDLSVIRLRLTGASGHGAGLAMPGDLARLGPPADPGAAARRQIHEILYPDTGPRDPNDLAVRNEIAVVMQRWFTSTILPGINAASDIAAFEAAVQAYIDWWELGRIFGLVTSFWYGAGDALEVEGLVFKGAALAAYEQLFQDANESCKQTGDIGSLMRLINLQEAGLLTGLIDPASSASRLASIMSPSNFCIRLKIVGVDAPAELAEGATGTISFAIVSDRPGVNLTPYELKSLKAQGTFDADSPFLLDVGTSLVPTDGITSRVEAPMTALRAVDGRTDEGKVQLGVTVFELDPPHATSEVTVDVTGTTTATTVTCSGDPQTIAKIENNIDDMLAIVFDGSTTCRLARNLSDDDDPDVVLVLDADPGEPGFDTGGGSRWSRDDQFKAVLPAGTYTMRAVRKESGAVFAVQFTLQGTTTGSMTLRDVTITSAAP